MFSSKLWNIFTNTLNSIQEKGKGYNLSRPSSLHFWDQNIRLNAYMYKIVSESEMFRDLFFSYGEVTQTQTEMWLPIFNEIRKNKGEVGISRQWYIHTHPFQLFIY